MCGVFGIIGSEACKDLTAMKKLIINAETRGRDSTGVLRWRNGQVDIFRSDERVRKLFSKIDVKGSELILGHGRLITNGSKDNQPIFRDEIAVFHNGIVVNADKLWKQTKRKRQQTLDSEVIAALFADELDNNNDEEQASLNVLKVCEGVVSAIIYLPKRGKLCLLSNNGSMYLGQYNKCFVFASEKWPLCQLGCKTIDNIRGVKVLNAPEAPGQITQTNHAVKPHRNLIPKFVATNGQEQKLNYTVRPLRRCQKCILPETMPFIEFDEQGICNYCFNHKPQKHLSTLENLSELVAPYKKQGQVDCVVPFSGGRDSCFALHLAVAELGFKPVAFTYDWGMVTDLGRRNISRMCAALGVENIIVAADIEQKRKNIRLNLNAWLKKPHLGMLNLLMAGDKHFFQHVETVKKKVGAPLNLWGINPLETTHFKAGFLGVPPSFQSKSVYRSGWLAQYEYQRQRLKQMIVNPRYINKSLFDTLFGEYWRSVHKKTDYFHLFDYYTWDEKEINDTLKVYNWETARDTQSTWRIGDGTAAFYNYVYHRTAGFSEHDTFRSNQIRAGQITRQDALNLIEEENRPRYENIKWYLDAVGVDFDDCIDCVNSMKTLH